MLELDLYSRCIFNYIHNRFLSEINCFICNWLFISGSSCSMLIPNNLYVVILYVFLVLVEMYCLPFKFSNNILKQLNYDDIMFK